MKIIETYEKKGRHGGLPLRKLRCIVTVTICVCVVLCCKEAYPETISVTDAAGKTVSIRIPVNRVAAMNSDVLEVMRALDVQDRVAGVYSEITREKEFWGHLSEKPKMGSWRNANLEALAGLHPDLVIAYEGNPGPELEKKLGAMGIQVIRLNFYKIGTQVREIRDLGRILGREREAEEFCAWIEDHFSLIRGRLKDVMSKPRVYVESYSDYHAAGPGSGADEMCAIAGGNNISSVLSLTYPEVSPEWVVAEKPDVIVKGAAWSNGYEKSGEEYLSRLRTAIMGRPVWGGIPAVKTGRVLVMDSCIWTGPSAIIGVCYMAQCFHPDRFKDLDPGALHREYINRFQRIPFKGVYVSKGPE